jgi:hypothetical protein
MKHVNIYRTDLEDLYRWIISVNMHHVVCLTVHSLLYIIIYYNIAFVNS